MLWLCGPDAADADAGAGTVATGVPAGGTPPNLSQVVHPDGASAPAWLLGVEGEFKVVLVVVTELGMSAGKTAAQAAHAAVGLYRQCQARRQQAARTRSHGAAG